MQNFCKLKILHILHPRYRPKIIEYILKNKQRYKYMCIHEITRLVIMKMKMKMINRSYRYNMNRAKSRLGHKYSNIKRVLLRL